MPKAQKPIKRPTKQPAAKKSTAKKPLVEKREVARKTVVKKPAPVPEKSWRRPDYMTVIVLVGFLFLSVINLISIINVSGYATAMEESRNLMMDNLTRVVESQSEQAAMIEEEEPAVVEPDILWSVVKFAEGEQVAIESNLIEPLLTWQALATPAPTAILIERRYASSTNVAVRLFLEDGEEYGFLWPEKGPALKGIWLPPCGPNSPEGLDPVSCPTEYLEKFPQITEALLEMAE